MAASLNEMTGFEGRNRRLLILLGLVVGLMLGLAYASVPLYDLFCRVTGFGGTTQQAATAPAGQMAGQPVQVRFDANVNPALNWSFHPVDGPVRLVPGEETVIYYRATNLGEAPSSGTATFNVTPPKAGVYFMKIECFCFTEQMLAAGESVDMPVRFFISPDIADDVNTRDVSEIVLSYTFFPLHRDQQDSGNQNKQADRNKSGLSS